MAEIILRKAEMDDVAAICSVMDAVEKSIIDKKAFVVDGEEFIKRHIKESGFILLAELDKRPAAFLIVRFPGMDKDNLGRDIGVKEKYLLQVAHMESVGVHPDFRGNSLQRKLLIEAEKYLGDYKYLMATVYPENKYSLDNFQKQGFEIMLRKQKYAGIERFVLRKLND